MSSELNNCPLIPESCKHSVDLIYTVIGIYNCFWLSNIKHIFKSTKALFIFQDNDVVSFETYTVKSKILVFEKLFVSVIQGKKASVLPIFYAFL